MKIFFFGAGSFAHSIWEKELKSKIYTDEYLAFIDNNPALCKGFSGGIKIIKPCDIDNYELDYVVITSLIYETSIREQLTEQLKLPKEKILTFAEYSRKSYARWAYWNRYGSRDRNTKATANKLESLVVYTSITGNYDKLKEPLFVADNITYVCFTNNYDIKSKIWNVEYIKNSSIDNNHLAKHFKMNPHLYFPDYEISVWVDGKYQIMDDFRMYIAQYKKKSSILCFPHPERQCICEELAACILQTCANNRDMINQVSDYLKEGYPLNYGLYECGCIMRLHNDMAIKSLMSKWENEVLKYSVRDQLSFPYVCWKYGVLPDICDLDINKNRWLVHTGHIID